MIKKFKQKNLGAYRAIIVGTIPCAITFAVCFSNGNAAVGSLYALAGILIYWLCAIAGVWIYQGFTENK